MLVGDLGIWLYENLAGIKPDPEQPGFKHIVMRPEPVGDLQFVKASHRSPYGLIASDWQKQDGVFRWNITVPANTTATVYVPAKSAESVTENGKPAVQAQGVKLREDGEWPGGLLRSARGNYSFESHALETRKAASNGMANGKWHRCTRKQFAQCRLYRDALRRRRRPGG